MYWYNIKVKSIVAVTAGIILAACLQACTSDNGQVQGPLKYFDLKGFFESDVRRLNKLNVKVVKTVTHNNDVETKTVQIADWRRELDLFTAADINRPAWKDSYTIIDEDNTLIYRAKYPELKVREILIKKEKGQVKWILIFNKAPKNILYETAEKLSYFPDSLYMIEKVQKVRLMGSNVYKIRGVISR
jgi:hypothetical protein